VVPFSHLLHRIRLFMWTKSQKDNARVRESFTVAVDAVGFFATLFADHKDDAEVSPNVRAATSSQIQTAPRASQLLGALVWRRDNSIHFFLNPSAETRRLPVSFGSAASDE